MNGHPEKELDEITKQNEDIFFGIYFFFNFKLFMNNFPTDMLLSI